MSFNFCFILMAIITISACGVKGDPIAPKGSEVPSLMKNYPDLQTENPVDKTVRKKR